MNDTQTTLEQLKKQIKQFVDERDWNQFHSPKNLAMYLSIEANELLEQFAWMDNAESFAALKTKREAIEDECADVLIVLAAFANACNIDLADVFAKKLEKTKQKYPIAKAKGRYTKYTEL